MLASISKTKREKILWDLMKTLMRNKTELHKFKFDFKSGV